MSIYLRIILVVISMLSMMNVMKRVRRFKLQIENSIFWIIFSLLLILVAVFPDPMFWLADLLGIQSPANMVFLFVIFILMLAMPSGSIIAMIVREYGGKTEEEDICSKGVLMTTLFSIITIPIVVLFL